MVVFPAAPWVTEVHNLTASELGSVSVAIGIGEMVGELAVILVGDRYSKRLSHRDFF